jgi:hypothetical protein
VAEIVEHPASTMLQKEKKSPHLPQEIESTHVNKKGDGLLVNIWHAPFCYALLLVIEAAHRVIYFEV